MPVFSNQATLSYNNIETRSNIVQGSYGDELTMTKSAVSSSYRSGDTISFSISIVNSGRSDCTDLALCDDLGAYNHSSGMLVPLSCTEGSVKVYCNGALQDDSCVIYGPPLTISRIHVPACGNVLILYSARVNSFAPAGRGACISNTAILSGRNLSAPVHATAEIEAACAPSLTVSKSLCPEAVTGCEPLTYTLVIQNSGTTPATRQDNIIITDCFNPVLSITDVELDGRPLSCPGDYCYDPATGIFATAAGCITVPAATCSQNMSSGLWSLTPGTAVLTITGQIIGGNSSRNAY